MNTSLDDLVAGADRALDAMHGAAEALSAIRVVRRSDDASLTVTVDGSGALVGLELAPDLSRESATRLATAIVATASAAAQEALEQRASILENMQGSLTAT